LNNIDGKSPSTLSEDFLDDLDMEMIAVVKGTNRGCASFGHQDMNMRMEVNAITESLHQ
jgi:hypothetical protein